MKSYFLSIALSSVLVAGAWGQADTRNRGSDSGTQTQANSRTISGRVTDASGAPISGATVVAIVPGQTAKPLAGTYADGSGNFTLFLRGFTSNVVIRASAVNFAAREVALGSGDSYNFSLEEDILNTDEIVVSALGLERDRRSINTATQQIDNATLVQGNNQNAISGLQGKVSGVQITNSSGSVGGSVRIVIRGGASITGNNQPLIVLNGVPIDNTSTASTSRLAGVDPGSPINDINPQDIESINVLKGPAAAALYGARAANGAIMITTKGASSSSFVRKKFEVEYNASIGFQNLFVEPDFQNEYAEGDGGNFVVDNGSNWGPRITGQRVENPDFALNGLGPDSINLRAYPDNLNDFLETGIDFQHTIRFSGGNDAANFSVSVGQTETKGIYPNTEWKRWTVGVNGRARLANNVTAGATINYFRSGGPNRNLQGQDRTSLGWLFQYLPRSINITDYEEFTLPNQPNVQRNFGTFFDNPYWSLERNFYSDQRERFQGTATIEYSPFDFLQLLVRLGSDLYTDSRLQRFDKGSLGVQNGAFTDDLITQREFNSDFIATFSKQITDDINVRALVGFNIRQNQFETSTILGTGLIVPTLYSSTNAVTLTPSTFESKRRLYGVYGEVSAIWRNMVSVGVTARNDWSSTLPVDERSYFYPSVNAGFIFSELPFLKDNKILSYGKVSGSFAQVGNDTDPYQLFTLYITGAATEPFNLGAGIGGILFPVNNVPGVGVSNILRPGDLRPESTTSYEVSLELSFLNGRIGVQATGFEQTTEDFIISVPISATTGYSSIFINSGDSRTVGIEGLVTAVPVKLKNGFQWTITWNATKFDKEVTSLAPGIQNLVLGGFNAASSQARIGEDYPVLFGTAFLRNADGSLRLSAAGLPQADPVQRVLGSVQPDFITGVQNTFSYTHPKYGDVSLGVLIDASFGGNLWGNTPNTMRFSGSVEETLPGREEPFVVEGTDPTGTAPNTVPVTAQQFWETSPFLTGEQAVFDATWIKLREIRLSYKFPNGLLEKTPIGSAQIGLFGRNLALLRSEVPHIDPETSLQGNTNAQGLEYGNVFSTRTFGFDLRITF